MTPRRATDDLFTPEQVHLLPGYPEQNGSALLVRVYVQMPLGFTVEVLPATALVQVVLYSQEGLESSINKTIGGVTIVHVTETTTLATAIPTEAGEKSETWKWVVIGVVVALVLVLTAAVFVVCYM